MSLIDIITSTLKKQGDTTTKKVTYKIKSKGRKYFKGENDKGYTNNIVINDVSKDFEVGETYTFSANVDFDYSKYGVKVTVTPISEEDAQEKERSKDIETAKKWLGWVEEKAEEGYLYEKGLNKIKQLDVLDVEEIKDRVDKAKETVEKVKNDRIKKLKEIQSKSIYLNVPYEEKDYARQYGARWDSIRKKWYYPGQDLPQELEKYVPVSQVPLKDGEYRIGGGSGYGYEYYSPGTVIYNKGFFENGPEYLYVIRSSKTYYSDDGMSFGVGEDSGYYYTYIVREATPEEAKEVKEVIEKDVSYKESKKSLDEIKDRIISQGDRPEKADAQGDIVYDTFNIYGGGERFVIDNTYIWYIQNNGADGDNWELNNVSTGGAGAIGWRVPYDEELAENIREKSKNIKTGSYGKPIVFLGGETKTDWRKDVVKEFENTLTLIDPVDPDWDPEENIYDELKNMLLSNDVVFYNGGKGTEHEKEFLDSLDLPYVKFDNVEKLKEYLNNKYVTSSYIKGSLEDNKFWISPEGYILYFDENIEHVYYTIDNDLYYSDDIDAIEDFGVVFYKTKEGMNSTGWVHGGFSPKYSYFSFDPNAPVAKNLLKDLVFDAISDGKKVFIDAANINVGFTTVKEAEKIFSNIFDNEQTTIASKNYKFWLDPSGNIYQFSSSTDHGKYAHEHNLYDDYALEDSPELKYYSIITDMQENGWVRGGFTGNYLSLEYKHNTNLPTQSIKELIQRGVDEDLTIIIDTDKGSNKIETSSQANEVLRSLGSLVTADHKYGCLYCPVPENLRRTILKDVVPNIPHDMLSEEKDLFGIEADTHITTLYGIDNNPETVEVIKEFFTEPIKLKTGHIDYFDNEHTVAYVSVESKQLTDLHNKLKDNLFNKDNYDDYKPHITIAYLKPGSRLNSKIKTFEWETSRLILINEGDTKIIDLNNVVDPINVIKGTLKLSFDAGSYAYETPSKIFDDVREKFPGNLGDNLDYYDVNYFDNEQNKALVKKRIDDMWNLDPTAVEEADVGDTIEEKGEDADDYGLVSESDELPGKDYEDFITKTIGSIRCVL
jgi:hypothetical protein